MYEIPTFDIIIFYIVIACCFSIMKLSNTAKLAIILELLYNTLTWHVFIINNKNRKYGTYNYSQMK